MSYHQKIIYGWVLRIDSVLKNGKSHYPPTSLEEHKFNLKEETIETFITHY